MKGQIASLLVEIEKAERRCLEKFGASDGVWEAPKLTFLNEFHAKYDSWKQSHPDYYREKKEEAYRQQISILKTQLRIARKWLRGGGE